LPVLKQYQTICSFPNFPFTSPDKEVKLFRFKTYFLR